LAKQQTADKETNDNKKKRVRECVRVIERDKKGKKEIGKAGCGKTEQLTCRQPQVGLIKNRKKNVGRKMKNSKSCE